MLEDRNVAQVDTLMTAHRTHPVPYLVAAVTGRALAASARRGGHRVIVLDYFADLDCASRALACRAVVARTGLRFDREALLTAADELAPPAHSAGLVYGSGFEGRTGLLRRLATGRRLCGNRPDVVRAIKDPARFFPLLSRLGMRFPETRLTLPAAPEGWLVKQTGGAGGVHVRPAGPGPVRRGAYYQRFQPGRALSVLFLANGERARIIGCNRQWTAAARPELPYQFGGAVGGISLPGRMRSEISAGLDQLVAATGLVGLNGIDVLVDDGVWWVLELNPRPTATIELYDADFPRGLFDWHLRACAGDLPDRVPARRAARAQAVAYAAEPWQATSDSSFPPWCRDRPRPGTRFIAGDPVCTVHASATDPRRATQLVRRRLARLGRMLAGTPVPAGT
jgi:predicted ATP-grasp superfamily ATP-dependent carboligase